MAGGLMQLVAYGAQDVYLTGNPQITFFKVVYRRHTNFSMEIVDHPLNGSPDFGRRVNVEILRNGDLAMQLYLKVNLKSIVDTTFTGKFAWVRRLGHALIKNVNCEIGGSEIDKHYGTWMDIWYELTHTYDQERGLKEMIGDVAKLTRLDAKRADGTIKDAAQLMIPLKFWFCRNPGLALPLIALQYHQVRLNFEFADAAKLGVFTSGFNTRLLGMQDASLLVNYVYLDTEERRRFAQVGHEYLIEQLQFTGEEALPTTTSGTTNYKSKLQFNHPSKELIWAIKGGNFTSGKSFLAYTHLDDWTTALDDAALNVATGMFKVTTAAVGTNEVDVSAGGSFLTNIAGAVTHRVNVDVSGVLDSSHKIVMMQNVLATAPYNLGDKIDFVALTIESTGQTLNNVKVLAHTMSIRDISIPVDSWTTDARYVKTLDIVVHQHHNFGVLLDGSGNPVEKVIIQLNGHDRFDQREGAYFNYVQPNEAHTRTPCDGINVYSFAIHPEQHQPSGTANLSRIDSTQLSLTLKDPTVISAPANSPSLNFFTTDTNLFVFDFNYNVLRIMSGIKIEKSPYRDDNFSFTCAKQETPLLVPELTGREKVCKILGLSFDNLYNLLVLSCNDKATLSNCGKLLRAFITTLVKQFIRGTRLIAEPNSKNMKDWIIRSKASSMKKNVQRLDVSGFHLKSEAQGIVRPLGKLRGFTTGWFSLNCIGHKSITVCTFERCATSTVCGLKI
jgi:hypothetical protein